MDSQNLQQLVLIFLVAGLITISPSYSVPYQTLYTICARTKNEEVCVGILQTDPRTNSSTLPQLGLISINLTRIQTHKNLKVFADLRRNATSPPVKAAYENCTRIYGRDMVSLISEAYKLSERGRYKDIQDRHLLGQVEGLAYKCEMGLPPSSPTGAISQTMIMTSEAGWSVNMYLESYPPQS